MAWVGPMMTAINTQSMENMRHLLGTFQGGSGAAAAVLGPIGHCQLGKDKTRRYKKWKDWHTDFENKMNFIGNCNTDAQKLSFLRSCAGTELTEMWEKEARIRPIAEVENGIRKEAHTYAEVLDETRKTLLKMVNRDRAIIELLRVEQSNKSFMNHLSKMEDQARLCEIAAQEPLNNDDLKRISLLAGIKDRSLAEKAMAEEYTLRQLCQAAINREDSRENAEALRGKTSNPLRRVEDEDEYLGGTEEARINHLQSLLDEAKDKQVNKMRQSGKYSGRRRGEEDANDKCPRCTYEKHGKSQRCPAEGCDCRTCGKTGHFAQSKNCGGQKKKTTRRVKEQSCSSSNNSE